MSDEKEIVNALAEKEEAQRKSFVETLHLNHGKKPALSISVEEREKQIAADEKERDEWQKDHPGEGLRKFHEEREKKRTAEPDITKALDAAKQAPADDKTSA
jgi:hypothetical protein